MPVEICTDPDETAALAAQAIAQIDATLARLTQPERDAFWASVRKCYNTPYNDPTPRDLPKAAALAQAPSPPPAPDLPDLAVTDRSMPDLPTPDLAMPDLAMPDLSTPDLDMPVAAMRAPGFGAEAHVS